MKQKFIRSILVVLVVFVACCVIAMLAFDTISKSLIQSKGSEGLGVEVVMESMHIGFFNTESNLRGLTIANPDEFKTNEAPTILSIGDIEMEFSLLSLLGESIDIPTASVSGITLRLDQRDGESNINTLIDHISLTAPSDEGGSGKPLNISMLTIKDITVVASGEFTIVDTGPVEAHITEIVLHDVGTAGGVDDAVEVMTATITQAILHNLSEHPVEGISKLVVGQVTGLIDQLPVVKELGLGSIIQGVTDGVGKGVDDILNDVGDLLGGGK